MPQVLKEEVREKIQKSARDEFYKSGYKSATMKIIAENADIPAGLIYNYFKNKEHLFEQVVNPVLSLLKGMVSIKTVNNPECNLYDNELPAILHCIENYRMEMVILIDKSEGSSFAETKNELIYEITEHLKITRFLKETCFDEIFYHILATNFMEGVFEIARHYRGSEWAEKMLELLIRQHMHGISSLSILRE